MDLIFNFFNTSNTDIHERFDEQFHFVDRITTRKIQTCLETASVSTLNATL